MTLLLCRERQSLPASWASSTRTAWASSPSRPSSTSCPGRRQIQTLLTRLWLPSRSWLETRSGSTPQFALYPLNLCFLFALVSERKCQGKRSAMGGCFHRSILQCWRSARLNCGLMSSLLRHSKALLSCQNFAAHSCFKILIKSLVAICYFKMNKFSRWFWLVLKTVHYWQL